MRIYAALFAVAILAACTPSTTTGGGSTAAVQDSIRASCADGTIGFDCSELNAGPDVSLQGAVLFVGIHAAAEGDANRICSALAAMHFDANGKDLGYTNVSVVSGGQSLASCRIP